MNKWVHYALQAVAVVVQVGNGALHVVPDKYKPLVGAVVGLAQVVLHTYATNHNPDGTPATVAYQPKS